MVAFNGLAGYRTAFDRRATLSEQADQLEGRPTYVMASTSPRVATWSYDEQLVHWTELRMWVEREEPLPRPLPERGGVPRTE